MFRTLIVDDHAGFRGSISALLQQQFPQVSVVEVGDATEALRMIRDCVTNLVLLDIKIPGGNGIALTKVIKATCAPITVVILTTHDLPQYRQAAFRNGADDFLYKGSTSCMNDILARVEGEISAWQKHARSPVPFRTGVPSLLH